ncbi:MAG: hypothetical protein ABSB31_08485 [Dehalococcoidia bacterium]|jgi:hypothetical protein
MSKLIDRILLHKVTVIEYTCGYVSTMIIACVLMLNSEDMIISVVAMPTVYDIALAIVFPIVSIWMFYIAARFFAIPLYDLLTVYNSVRSSPMEYTTKNR